MLPQKDWNLGFSKPSKPSRKYHINNKLEFDSVSETIKKGLNFSVSNGQNELGPIVLLFHDFSDNSKRFAEKIEFFGEIASEIIIPDFHDAELRDENGEPRIVSLEEYKSLFYNSFIKKIEDQSAIFVGVGLGANLALIATHCFSSQCSDLVMINPIFDFDNVLPGGVQQIARYVSGFSGNPTILTWDARLLTRNKDLLEELNSDEGFFQESIKLQSVRNLKEIRKWMEKEIGNINARLLMVHSEKSRLSNQESVLSLYTEVNSVEKHLLLMPGADHYQCFGGEENEVWENIISWLKAGAGDGVFYNIV